MALKTFQIVQGLSRTPLLFILWYLANIIFENTLQKHKISRIVNLELWTMTQATGWCSKRCLFPTRAPTSYIKWVDTQQINKRKKQLWNMEFEIAQKGQHEHREQFPHTFATNGRRKNWKHHFRNFPIVNQWVLSKTSNMHFQYQYFLILSKTSNMYNVAWRQISSFCRMASNLGFCRPLARPPRKSKIHGVGNPWKIIGNPWTNPVFWKLGFRQKVKVWKQVGRFFDIF